MLDMVDAPNKQQESRRVQADQEDLARRIAQALPHDGEIQARPGLYFRRHSGPTEPVHGFYVPALCVIAQGRKELLLGGHRFQYDPAKYLITTLELPMTGQVVEASPQRPYLGLRLVLDPAVVASVVLDSELSPQSDQDGGVQALAVTTLDANLLDAALRLVRLIDNSSEYRAIAPLVVREIVYRLLTGPQATRMRHLATFSGAAHRMVRAIRKLRENFDKPLRVQDIARDLHMSVSGFHAHFKAVTAMSPLQFQKQLRLQEARQLLLKENLDAAEAGYRVGYDDAAHFSREYRRHFGQPPIRDVQRLRDSIVRRRFH